LLPKDILQVTYILERAFNDPDDPYFTLDHATYGQLNGSHGLAPF
jgi:hypothetical protein